MRTPTLGEINSLIEEAEKGHPDVTHAAAYAEISKTIESSGKIMSLKPFYKGFVWAKWEERNGVDKDKHIMTLMRLFASCARWRAHMRHNAANLTGAPAALMKDIEEIVPQEILDKFYFRQS